MRIARLGENLLSWFAFPKNRLSSSTLVGGAISWMAAVLSGSGWMPFSSIRCPRNLSFVILNSHLSGFNVALLLECVQVLRWVSYHAQTDLCRTLDIVHLPKDPLYPIKDAGHSLLKVLRGTRNAERESIKAVAALGVMNVERRQDCSARGICQKLLLASSLLNIFAPVS